MLISFMNFKTHDLAFISGHYCIVFFYLSLWAHTSLSVSAIAVNSNLHSFIDVFHISKSVQQTLLAAHAKIKCVCCLWRFTSNVKCCMRSFYWLNHVLALSNQTPTEFGLIFGAFFFNSTNPIWKTFEKLVTSHIVSGLHRETQPYHKRCAIQNGSFCEYECRMCWQIEFDRMRSLIMDWYYQQTISAPI